MAYRENELTAIVVPLTKGEIDRLNILFMLWSTIEVVSRAQERDPLVGWGELELIVSVDGWPDVSITNQIRDLFDAYQLERQFVDCRVNFCSINSEDNVYFRDDDREPLKVPMYGLKSGPNLQFFRTMRACRSHNTVLLNELDAYPIRVDWMSQLRRLTRGAESFWVLGSPYRGKGRLGPGLAHVNGNALYGVGLEGFSPFLRLWERLLLKELRDNPGLPYDVVFSRYCAKFFDKNERMKRTNGEFLCFSRLLCKIRHTDYIHNLAGKYEFEYGGPKSIGQYLTRNRSTVLIHGKPMEGAVLGYWKEEINSVSDRSERYECKALWERAAERMEATGLGMSGALIMA